MVDIFINTISNPAFTAILGFVTGHFWTLWRDKRKEFNAVAIPINIALLKQIDILKSGSFVDPFQFVAIEDFNMLEIHLPKRLVAKYRKDLSSYKECAKIVVNLLLVDFNSITPRFI